MYVSSCISVGRSLKSDFRFATEIKMVYMTDLRRVTTHPKEVSNLFNNALLSAQVI
jgi:hypothetical protein